MSQTGLDNEVLLWIMYSSKVRLSWRRYNLEYYFGCLDILMLTKNSDKSIQKNHIFQPAELVSKSTELLNF